MDDQIQSLKRQRRSTQIKVFTKWVNSYLTPMNLEVRDLIAEMSDGIRLFRLIELITGENLGRPNPGKQRFQRMDNISKCLNFLSKRFPLTGISAEDIMGGNANAILSLIWLIFINLQMINSPLSPSFQTTDDDTHNKAALLKWCQMQTSNYPGIRLEDFSRSWSNGMAFNAIIHHFRPDLIEYEKLNPNDAIANLNNAFNIADEKLRIPKFLDAADVAGEKSDEDSVLIYVAYIYKTFYQPKKQINLEDTIVQKKFESTLQSVPKPVQSSSKPITKIPPPVAAKLIPENASVSNIKEQNLTSIVDLVIFPDSWECNYCTFMNTPVTTICAICFNRKPNDAILAKDKGIQPTPPQSKDDDESDGHDWTEEDEILRRPAIKSSNSNAGQRISITLASPDIITNPSSESLSLSAIANNITQIESQIQSTDWKCQHCGFNNPLITKICGSCFIRRNDVTQVKEIVDARGVVIASDF